MIETKKVSSKSFVDGGVYTPQQKIANHAKFKSLLREIKNVVTESKVNRGRQSSVLLFDGETTVVLMALDTASFMSNGLMTVEGLAEFAEAGVEAVANTYRLGRRRTPDAQAEDVQKAEGVADAAQGETDQHTVQEHLAADGSPNEEAKDEELPAPPQEEKAPDDPDVADESAKPANSEGS